MGFGGCSKTLLRDHPPERASVDHTEGSAAYTAANGIGEVESAHLEFEDAAVRAHGNSLLNRHHDLDTEKPIGLDHQAYLD